MTLTFGISDNFRKVLDKLARKDRNLAIAVRKKIDQIVSSDAKTIEHFKNLRGDMSHLKRVQVGSFILTFRVEGNTLFFEDFDHHDRIYSK